MRLANRRTVLIAAAGAAAVAALPAFAEAADGTVAVFEAGEPAARAFARDRAPSLAVDGDRIRFARTLFREKRPSKVIGMTRYADFLLLAESAREEGYRTRLETKTSPDVTSLFLWTAERA